MYSIPTFNLWIQIFLYFNVLIPLHALLFLFCCKAFFVFQIVLGKSISRCCYLKRLLFHAIYLYHPTSNKMKSLWFIYCEYKKKKLNMLFLTLKIVSLAALTIVCICLYMFYMGMYGKKMSSIKYFAVRKQSQKMTIIYINGMIK